MSHNPSPTVVRFSGILNLATAEPARRGPGRPRIHPVVAEEDRRAPGRPPIYPGVDAPAQRPKLKDMPGVQSAAYYRGFPGGKAITVGEYTARAWEGVSAIKAQKIHADLDPGFLENKFRWGCFKAFATNRGGPVDEITYPAAAAYGQQWLVEQGYVKREDGRLTLRKKGQDLYNVLFKGRAPRDFTP